MLKRGKKTNDIAAKILDQSPKIQALRNEYLFNRKRAATRLRLITTMRVMEKELLTRKNINAQDTRTYSWLYKRDREWLEKMLPKKYARKTLINHKYKATAWVWAVFINTVHTQAL